jgi:oxygen-dependent protoporphyrinogen oxidase
MRHTQVAIIGGGITGLSAAWYLQQNGTDDYILIERDSRFGGKVVSETIETDEGVSIVDGGPETFVTRKPEAYDLIKELDLEDKIVEPHSESANVLHDDNVYRVSLNPMKFALSGIMSLRGKFRMLFEPLVPVRSDNGDESLADFVRRRLGDEALDRFLGPLLGGIYNANPEEQSLLYTSPALRNLELREGSLLLGMVRSMRAAKQRKGPKKPRFLVLEGGSQILIDEMVNRATGTLLTDTVITAVERSGEQYLLTLDDGEAILADTLIMAAPASAATSLFAGIAPDASGLLGTIKQASIGTLSLAYRTADLPDNLDVHGLIIPRKEERDIDALSWTSTRLDDRAPDSITLVRTFFGGGKAEMVALPDDELLRRVRAELNDLFGLDIEPVAYRAFRWTADYPRADVGHLDKIDTIETLLPDGVYLAGASYRGLGVPDCIRQGKQAALDAIEYVSTPQGLPV